MLDESVILESLKYAVGPEGRFIKVIASEYLWEKPMKQCTDCWLTGYFMILIYNNQSSITSFTRPSGHPANFKSSTLWPFEEFSTRKNIFQVIAKLISLFARRRWCGDQDTGWWLSSYVSHCGGFLIFSIQLFFDFLIRHFTWPVRILFLVTWRAGC